MEWYGGVWVNDSVVILFMVSLCAIVHPMFAHMLGGDSGLFRIWFSFTTGADYELTITKLGAADLTGFPLKVNADNTFVLKDDGYYRFDIGVQPGDLINMSSNVAISKVNDLQIQQIQIGA